MGDIQVLMDNIREWSDKTFGSFDRSLSILHHLLKEIPEVFDAISNNRGKRSETLEYADCLMLILDSASHRGITADELITATIEKLEINKNRKWGLPDENGVVEHIK